MRGFSLGLVAAVLCGTMCLNPEAARAQATDPFEVGEVAFYYNKKLFAKAGVKAEAIKSWDDFLGAVKTLKAAGILGKGQPAPGRGSDPMRSC